MVCAVHLKSSSFERRAHCGNGSVPSSRLSAISVHLIFFYVVEQLIYTFYEKYFSFQLCTTVERFYILTLQNLQPL